MSINANEEFIKRAFLQDIKSLTEKAKTKGVTAYAEKPSRPSLRPNERFLRNTIASVEHANRRAQESEMWSRRKAQLEREGVSTDQSPRTSQGDYDNKKKNTNNVEKDDRSDIKKEDEDEDAQHHSSIKSSIHDRLGKARQSEDDELQDLLGGGVAAGATGGRSYEGGGSVEKKVRGRGGIGPRIGVTGVYVPDPQIGLDYIGVEEKEVEREIDLSRDREGRKRDRRSESETSSSGTSSYSSDREEEERRKIRRRKRRRKEKESRKDDKKRKKERREKKKRKTEEKRSELKSSKRRREEKSKKQSKRRKRIESSSPSSS